MATNVARARDRPSSSATSRAAVKRESSLVHETPPTNISYNDGNIRFLIKEFPILGEDSLKLSKFALAVKIAHGDEIYKTVHDILIKMKAPPNERALDKILNNLNLNTELVQNAMKSNEVDGMIAYTRALAEQLKISGTPTFIMNDELIRGYVPFDTLISIVANKRD